jgi:hypothetical protein
VLDWWQALLLSLPALAVAVVAAFYGPAFVERVVQRRREERDFRQAQRLVAHELDRLGGDLQFTSEQSVAISPDSIGFFSTHEWEAHKTTLARLLDQQTWAVVASVYAAISRIRYLVVATGPGQPFERNIPPLLTGLVKTADQARRSLENAAPHQS